MELVATGKEEIEKNAGDIWPVYTAEQLAEMEDQPCDYVFDRLAAGEIGILTGEQGTGKSYLALQIEMSIALGGYDITGGGFSTLKSGKALHISLEDSFSRLKDRLRDILKPTKLTVKDFKGNLLVSEGGEQPLSLINSKGDKNDDDIRKLTVLSKNMRLVVIDTLSKSHMGDENSLAHMKTLMAIFKNIARKQGCAILLIHHPGKAEGNFLRGSSALKDLRYIAEVKKERGEYHFQNSKYNYGPAGKPIKFVRNNDGAFLFKNANDTKKKTERKENKKEREEETQKNKQERNILEDY
jgi:RecA-family ATPase